MSGIGAAVGLLLGGWLTGIHHVFGATGFDGWRLTFLINVPIGLAAAFFARRLLAESDKHPGELDVPGALAGTLGLVSIVYGLTRASQTTAQGTIKYGWGDTGTLAALVLGVALLVSFVLVRAPDGAPPDAFPDPGQPHACDCVHGHDDRARGDVLHVLLPVPLRAERDGLHPDPDGTGVPAVLLRHDHRGRRRRRN